MGEFYEKMVLDAELLQEMAEFLQPLEVSEDTLKGHVKDNLAGYKVPREIVFVEELPRSEQGKVLKRQLAMARISLQMASDAFDTAACDACGNDTIDGDEVCDGTDLGGRGEDARVALE